MSIIFFYFCLIFHFSQKNCVNINITSVDFYFIKYEKNENVTEIIYKYPLQDNLKISFSFGDLKIIEELKGSQYRPSIFVDKQRLYTKSNVHQNYFEINTICKLNNEQTTEFRHTELCCQINLRKSNGVFDRKVCKLRDIGTSSVCFVQLKVLKKQLNWNTEKELTLTSHLNPSKNGKCSINYTADKSISNGVPKKIIIVPEEKVDWTLTDQSIFGDLEIGIPFNSFVESKIQFYLRIRSKKKISKIEIECSCGSDLRFFMISFDRSTFMGEYLFLKESKLVKLFLKSGDGDSSHNWNSSKTENLVDLIFDISTKSSFNDVSKTLSRWISCRVASAIFVKYKLTLEGNTSLTLREPVKVPYVTHYLDLIPVFTDRTYFSILNDIAGPIKLQKNDLQVFSFSSVKEGSLVDLTRIIKCSPVSNSSINCYSFEQTKTLPTTLDQPNWNILLSMKNWHKRLSYPIELWHAQDWRTVVGDKTLNQVMNWRYYEGKLNKCRAVYQVSRLQLLARFIMKEFDNEENSRKDKLSDNPLLDLTSYVMRSNIQVSGRKISVALRNNAVFISALTYGESDISVINNNGKILGFDRIMVDDELVTVSDMQVSCIHRLNVTQSSNHFNPSFRSIIVQPQPSRNVEEVCYFKIKLVFSDNSVADIQDYLFTDLQIILRTAQESILIKDLDSFVYEPSKYKEPGKFSISIYESATCSKNKLIFEKNIILYRQLQRTTYSSRNTSGLIPSGNVTTKVTSTSSIAELAKDISKSGSIDINSLILSLKILIGLVALVALIIIINCIIKLRQRKLTRLSNQPLSCTSSYFPVEKLTGSTYSPSDITSQNSNSQHPPLLPPPGPLYNTPESSQLNSLIGSPDIFWGLPHGTESFVRNSCITLPESSLHEYQNQHLQNTKMCHSPNNNNVNENFLNENNTKIKCISEKNSADFTQDSESNITGSSGKNYPSSKVHVLPPCPPLRWDNSFLSSQLPISHLCYSHVISESNPEHVGQLIPNSSDFIRKPQFSLSVFSNSNDNLCGSQASSSDGGRKVYPKDD